ncbi:MAG: TonB-dependent receptor [Bryobacterales bacterium]|nr:TonB-dependent receptor [Bryobacterales bacterium]MBV9397903.1 TonB-dependent receptor [Bryobacterales bacterium]
MRIVLICMLACAAAFGQSDRGAITGTVGDPAGAVVASAPIEARNTETSILYQAQTSTTGNYTLAQLPVGTYELSVSVPGFKKYVRQNILVEVAQTVRIDVALEVGAANESVTVTAESSLLKTESGELSHTISAQRMIDLGALPIGGTLSSSQGLRFYMTELVLVPGTYAVSGFITGARVNGAPFGTQRTQIDGMDATNQINAVQAGTSASMDAVQETALQTSNYSAEFGQVGGGLFNMTMRSGANQFHGNAYDYLANEAFNASTPFVNTKPLIRRNDWGFNLGGPVWLPKVYRGRDKTFFYFNREQYREFFQTNDQAITVPTALYRAGNFTQALTGKTLGTDPLGNPILEGGIYDPLSVQTVNGIPVRTQFLNNRIPAARLDPVALNIQNLIPQPGNAAAALNLVPSFPNDRVTTNTSVRLDHQFTPKAKIAGTFTTNSSNSQYSQSLNGSEGLPPAITATRGTFSVSHNWRVNFDYSVKPNLLLHFGAGITLYQLNDHSPTTDFDQSTIGLNGTPNPGGRFPSISGLCVIGLGINTSPCTGTGGMMNMGPGIGGAQSLTKQMTPTYQASATWVKGDHTYKFGSEVRIFGYPLHSLAATNGSFVFSPNQTSQLSSCTSSGCSSLQSAVVAGGTVGFPYASFLLGLVNNGVVNPPADLRTGKHFLAFYAQDTWKITRKFTLDYGLRYDYATYPKEQYGRLPTLNPALANPTAGGHPGAVTYEATCNCSLAHNYPWAFGPRLGAAYQITPKTVFRAGFGVAYDGTATGSTGTASASANNAFSAPAFGAASMVLANGVPPAYVLPWPNFNTGAYPNPNFPASLNGMASVVDQNAGRPARQIQWSVGLQREIARDLVVEASYVANRGAWWLSPVLDNYNALTPQQLLSQYGLDINNSADRAILRAAIGSPAAGRFQNKIPYAGFPLSAPVAQALRPYPQFSSGLAPLWAPQGKTWYDSLQAKVTKRLSHGLDAQYIFTWAQEQQQGVEAGTVNDVFNLPQNKSLSGFSRPLVSTISVHYSLPAWGSNPVLKYVVRDWQLGSILTYASGLPILVPTSTNNLNTLLFRSTFYNRVPGVPWFLKDLNCHCIDPTKDLVLNPAAWSNPADGQWGTSAPYYGDYRYQRHPSETLSLGRVFDIKERARITVRMNFVNIFNRTQLNNPSATTPTAPTTRSGASLLTGGFGFINYIGGSTFTPPRQGVLEMRISF